MARGSCSAVLILSVWILLPTTYCDLQSNMEVVYKWRKPDWKWQSDAQREQAVSSGLYNPDHMLPLSVEVTEDRLFLSYGSTRKGSPATLATVPRQSQDTDSPLQTPYPSWDWHYDPAADNSQLDCNRTFLFVLRTKADSCGRLWVLDGGQYAYFETGGARVCPAKLVVFDLNTNQPIRTYLVPTDQYNKASSLTSVTVDTSTGCDDTYAYWANCIDNLITTYSWKTDTSWDFRNSRFAPSPANSSASTFLIQDVEFPTSDGVYQVVLPSSKVPPITGSGSLFWHVFNSYDENTVPAKTLRNPSAAEIDNFPSFKKIGERGAALGQSVVGGVDSRGIMFYTLASLDAVACWNTRHPYRNSTQAVLTQATPGALYPSGIDIVPSLEDPREEEVWLLSTGQVRAAYSYVNPNFTFSDDEYRLVVYRARVSELSKGSVCEQETVACLQDGEDQST